MRTRSTSISSRTKGVQNRSCATISRLGRRRWPKSGVGRLLHGFRARESFAWWPRTKTRARGSGRSPTAATGKKRLALPSLPEGDINGVGIFRTAKNKWCSTSPARVRRGHLNTFDDFAGRKGESCLTSSLNPEINADDLVDGKVISLQILRWPGDSRDSLSTAWCERVEQGAGDRDGARRTGRASAHAL